jgi:hypothetical protein
MLSTAFKGGGLYSELLMDLLKQNSTTRDDLGMRAVMDALEAEEEVIQHKLARRTGLHLKKVND